MNQICTPWKQHRTESSAISAVMSLARGVPAECTFRDFIRIHNSAYSSSCLEKGLNSATLFDIFTCGLLAALIGKISITVSLTTLSLEFLWIVANPYSFWF